MLIAPLIVAALDTVQPNTKAYTGAPPIQVASCSVVKASAAIPGSYFGPIVRNVGSLNVSFVNREAKPITKVAFTVNGEKTTLTVVDEGTFSTGVVINHTFPEPALTDENVSCIVESVAFADGSIWAAQKTDIGTLIK
jgi:hypothetical protein